MSLIASAALTAPQAAAEAGTTSLLQSLLGQESRSLERVTDGRMAALAETPEAAQRNVETISTSRFEEPFISSRPAATGGESWECLTEALYFEARGEDLRGMFAVGEVILNRVEDPRFPGSVCGVVNQGTGRQWACQFTYTCDGRPELVHEPGAWTRVGKVARLLLDGAPRDLTEGATHYHTTAVRPDWAGDLLRVGLHGVHAFYRWD